MRVAVVSAALLLGLLCAGGCGPSVTTGGVSQGGTSGATAGATTTTASPATSLTPPPPTSPSTSTPAATVTVTRTTTTTRTSAKATGVVTVCRYDTPDAAAPGGPYPFASPLSVATAQPSNADQKAAVESVQDLLNVLGYTGLSGKSLLVDGVYGRNTEHAVRSFQAAEGIVVDGEVGPQTWARLGTYCWYYH